MPINMETTLLVAAVATKLMRGVANLILNSPRHHFRVNGKEIGGEVKIRQLKTKGIEAEEIQREETQFYFLQ